MIRKKLTLSWIIVLLLIGMFHAFRLGTVGGFAVEYPAVYVDPTSTINETLTPPINYTTSIMTNYTGSDITSYQFSLTWDPYVLECMEVANGDIVTGGAAFFQAGPIDNIMGTLGVTGAFFYNPADVASGPGVLANVTFGVVGIGKSNITLGSVQLNAWNGTAYEFIVDGATMLDHIGHGYFDNRPAEYHDVSIQSITAPGNTTGGGNVSIDVRVGNGGTFTENVTVTVSYNDTFLDAVIIEEMENETSQTIEFIWDTYDFSANIEANQTYIIKANATIVDEDIFPPDNNRTTLITLRERHDVSILDNVEVSPETPLVGDNVNITVTVENQGSYDENVTIKINVIQLGKDINQTILMVEARKNKTFSFIWATTGLEPGSYFMRVYATIPDDDPEPPPDDDEETKTIWLTLGHDVAITSIVIPILTVYVGDNASINVNVANNGGFNETCTVKVFYNTTLIQNKSINVSPGDVNFTSFIWSTLGVAPGSYNITAEVILEGYEDVDPSNNIKPYAYLVIVKLPPGIITGVVTDFSSGEAIANATVTVNGMSAASNSSGAYVISDVPPGNYTVTASADGYEISSETITVTAGETETLDFTLKPVPITGIITGVVTDFSSGEAIANATVTVNGMSAASNSSGAYVISDVPPGNYTVTASADGYEISSETITVTAGETETLDFTLKPIQPLDILPYAGAAAIIIGIVATLAVYIFKIRKPKPT